MELLKLDKIVTSGTNPRKTFDQKDMDELAASILEKGVINPITVREHPARKGMYEVVAGERRVRASRSVQALHKDRNTIQAVIREMTDEEVLEIQIIENLQRRDISPMEEALAFYHLANIKGMTAEEIGARVGKSPKFVAIRLKLNQVIPEIQPALHENRLTIADALRIAAMPEKEQKEFYKELIEDDPDKLVFNKWTWNRWNNQLSNAPFDINDPNLVKNTPACSVCPYNTATAALFPTPQDTAYCQNPTCYKKKCDTAFKLQLAEAKDDSGTILVKGTYGSSTNEEKQLKDQGLEIIDSGDFDELDMPEKPEFDDFEGNNDTDAEDIAEFEQELENYNKELAQYNEKINSGSYIKALVVTGNEKGKIKYGRLRKKAAQKKGAPAKLTETKTETDPEEEIEACKQEIKRLHEREDRNKQLDAEKVWTSIKVHVKPEEQKDNTRELLQEERDALAWMIFSQLESGGRAEYLKMRGEKKVRLYDQMEIAQEVFFITTDEQLRELIRFSLAYNAKELGDKFSHQNNPTIWFYHRLMKETHPTVVLDAQLAQDEKSTSREKGVLKRIKQNQDRIAELKKEIKAKGGKK